MKLVTLEIASNSGDSTSWTVTVFKFLVTQQFTLKAALPMRTLISKCALIRTRVFKESFPGHEDISVYNEY